ncbi:MAG: phosphoribosylanthranilate isomerase [Candidatus Omnitrophica bacterium]|nr:phosphoribosylanthranilate isomerase [Candidatus Omnitrophota bacterium]
MTARVKICGVTEAEDALACLEMGADALGFNFYSKSPRHLDLETARDLCAKLPPFGLRVGVFVDAAFDEIMEAVRTVRLDTVQLHGNEPPEISEDLMEAGVRVWKAIRVENLGSLKPFEDYPCDALVLDAFDPKVPGGSGKSFDWSILAEWKSPKPWILSGGLNPDNVAEALENLSPSGVDVASGVESSPGRKDPDLVKAFIHGAKRELALV